jgi:hypothetical protein
MVHDKITTLNKDCIGMVIQSFLCEIVETFETF